MDLNTLANKKTSPCVNMIRSRLFVDFSCYKAAGDLDSFNDLWCFQDVLCSVTTQELVYADYLV